MIDDDPVTRWYKRKLLEDMSKNTRQPVLAEMAREILAGRLTTRQAMSSDAYMEALGVAARPALARYQNMSEVELAAAEREGRTAVEQLKGGGGTARGTGDAGTPRAGGGRTDRVDHGARRAGTCHARPGCTGAGAAQVGA